MPKKIVLNQKKQVGGIIRYTSLKLFFLTFISCYFIVFPVKAKNNNNVSIIRDAEIEFFLEQIINNFTTSEQTKNLSIKPIIVFNESINAFVTGNNKIYIHSGLLENLDSFEELEGIIAHELGHLVLGHVESRKIMHDFNSKITNAGIFALIGLSLSGMNNNIEGAIIAGNDFYYKNQFRYNRTQELEADIFSIKALNRLKKSSLGLNDFFKKIKRRNQLFLNKNNYYNSHPNPENRLDIINSMSRVKKTNLTKVISYKNIELDLQKLKIKLLAYTKNKNQLNLIKKNLKKNDPFFSAINFYCKNDLEKSIKYTKVYQQQNTRNPFAYEMLGSLNFLNGNYIEAVKNFTESLKKNDELKIVPSPILKFSIANALIKIDNKDSLRKALTILEQLIPIKNKSIRLWRLIGVTSHKLKMKSISMVAQAEEKILKKQYKKAKKIASKALQDNNIKSLYKIRALDIINLN
ncbi:MAG: hypothetical protein CMN44_10715 [SAR116 cluster bacterium]|nr:hypothetical protein [SAR116 cluster bacterium]RPH07457.1 MAG: hypothetical protein CBC14_010575 [Alphaproteobacteria bacterium TMED54]|tara:strand:- start:730 stop:2124 length:1395 start_codon:yes stop_codon:yes gene_type:complete